MPPRSPARPPVPRALARPLASLYGAIVARRNRRFDLGRGVIEFDRPTVSVGNLSVGGTGKTPMVMRCLSVLDRAGLRPCVAMRGYRSRDGISDEAAEYARAFPGVPVVAQPDRVDGLIRLFGTALGEERTAIVLDDGFQHRRIARDLDIVLLDATRPPFDDDLLPLGWLREPVASLKRADAIVITHAEAAGVAAVRDIEARAGAVHPRAALAVCAHEWTGLRAGDGADLPVAWLRAKTLVAACAIGNPGPFFSAAASAAGRPLAGTLELRDHDAFKARTVARLCALARDARADALIVTEKDWVKLEGRAIDWPCPVVRPHLGLRFLRGGDALDELILARVSARPHVPVEEFLGPDAPSVDPDPASARPGSDAAAHPDPAP